MKANRRALLIATSLFLFACSPDAQYVKVGHDADTTGSAGGPGTGGAPGGPGGNGGAADGSGDASLDSGDRMEGRAGAPAAEDASFSDAISESIVDDDDGSFPAHATLGSCDPLTWTVSASSSEGGNPPVNAIDGNPATRWSTGVPQSFGQYYQIDFGGYVRLSAIRLDDTGGSQGDFPRAYDVLVSDDGVDFSRTIAAGAIDVAPADNVVAISFAPRAVRFLRIQMTASSGSWWSIHELGAICDLPDGDGGFMDGGADPDLCSPDGGAVRDAGAGDPSNRASWKASASSTSTVVGDAVANAIDGNVATRWSSGKDQAGDEWFKLDLGSVGCISEVWLDAASADFPVSYKLETSTDDIAYKLVARGQGQSLTKIAFATRLARYVRIEQVGVDAAHWWSIAEIAIKP